MGLPHRERMCEIKYKKKKIDKHSATVRNLYF